MKKLIVLLGLFFLPGSIVLGADPDLSKVFLKEKVFGKSEHAAIGMFSYEYLTDREFKGLEEQVVKFLGEGWKKEDVKEMMKEDEDLKALFAKQGMEMMGSISLTKKDEPTKMVLVQLIKSAEKIEGKKFMLTLTGIGMKKALEDEKKKEKPAPEKQPAGGVLKD